jgi:ABC-type oligopeptide transport system ATPase subunit
MEIQDMQRKLTTIQVNATTLLLLKKLKEEMKAASYEEAITKFVAKNRVKKSMAGYLGKFLTQKEKEEILRDDRREEERV